MRFSKFVFAALFATTASLAAPTSAQAEPTLNQILTSLYPGYSQNLVGTADIGNSGVGDPMTSALFTQSSGLPNGQFDLQVKYAGNSTTFGYFNPPASTTATAPATTSFNAVFTIVGSNTFTAGNVGGDVTLHSHLSGGLSGTATALNGSGNVGITATFNNAGPSSANGVFTVSSGLGGPNGENIALAIRSPVSVSGNTVSTSGSTQYSSVNSHNQDGFRHMVTYILSKAGEEDKIIVAWEDLPSGGNSSSDWDYNDLVIELVQGENGGLIPQPEPTTMALLGLGFAGLCGRGVRRRLVRRNTVCL